MKLDDMKVTSNERVGSVSGFTVQKRAHKQVDGKIFRMAGGVGVCALALIGAVTLRWQQIALQQPTAAVSAAADETLPPMEATVALEEPEPTDMPGSLRFAEVQTTEVQTGASTKWTAPVLTNDVEILRDRKLVRFSAAAESVLSCIDGKVTKTGKNDTYGTFVTIKGADVTIKLYGFETLAVKKNAKITEGDVLGTVPVGRSVYLSVEKNGKTVDPSDYVDLTIRGRRASA